jgi:uncharacterized membrane-anchored protein YjiN (DUF445 family)
VTEHALPPLPRGAPTGPLVGSEPDDAARAVALRRYKVGATAMLVLAAGAYAATTGRSGVWGYVAAAAEASMVGGLADWFAVTALFRRPLGLPIPHTAIIPTRKDALATSLETFFLDNFLSATVVHAQVRAAAPTRRLGTWLADPAHASRAAHEVADVAAGVLRRLRPVDVAAIDSAVEQLFVRAGSIHWSPHLSRVLAAVVDDGLEQRLLDVLVGQLGTWLRGNRETVFRLVIEQAPSWTPGWLDERLASRVYDQALQLTAEVAADPHHTLRGAVTDFLRQLADDLKHDQNTQERTEELAARLLGHPEIRAASLDILTTGRDVLVRALSEQEGVIATRLAATFTEVGARLATDAAQQETWDGRAAEVVAQGVTRYGGELVAVVSHTIARWDGREAARRIELYVGRDLQFIRVNGTVVGGLAGLAIHTATVLLH